MVAAIAVITSKRGFNLTVHSVLDVVLKGEEPSEEELKEIEEKLLEKYPNFEVLRIKEVRTI